LNSEKQAVRTSHVFGNLQIALDWHPLMAYRRVTIDQCLLRGIELSLHKEYLLLSTQYPLRNLY